MRQNNCIHDVKPYLDRNNPSIMRRRGVANPGVRVSMVLPKVISMVLHEVGTEQRVLIIQDYLLAQVLYLLTEVDYI